MGDLKATLSISRNTFYKNEKVANEGFKAVHIKWEQMHKVTARYHYSPMMYKNGKRCKKNVIGYGNLLIYDCDNDFAKGKYSYNSQELKKHLDGIMYYLCTTSSHRVKEHRLRLIFPCDRVVPRDTTPEQYQSLLITVIEFLGLDLKKFDTSCFSTDRQFAPNRTQKQLHHYGDGQILNLDSLMDLLSCNTPTTNKPFRQTTNLYQSDNKLIRSHSKYSELRKSINSKWTADHMRELLKIYGFSVNGWTLKFTDNKTTAVQINKKTGWIHDHSDGKGIDAVSLLHDYCNIPLKEATKKVAQMVGIGA